MDTTDALREKHVRPYTVTLGDETTAAAFAKDFDGKQDGACVTVSTKQTLEQIFMDYYGGDK
jgi:ABC-2 type transport system ATP-binding protein